MKRIRTRGVILLEAIVAFALLAVMLALALELIAATGAGMRDSQRRAIAVQEAANVMERVGGLPAEDLTAERLAAWRLSPEAREILPGGELALAVEPITGDGPHGKHVTLAITWRNAAQDREAPVRLDYWAYDAPGAAP